MKYFEVFKAGKYPQGVFSSQDVEALAANYDPQFCEAPITLDHEQKGPAFGWVSELKAENGKLKALFRDVADELKEYVNSGKYRKISVEIYREIEGKKPYLKAVSFLGAAIPQVKGMTPVEFKEGESEIYIFENDSIQEELSILNLQDRIKQLEKEIESFKNEDTPEIISKLQEQISIISAQITKFHDNFAQKQQTDNEIESLKQQIKKTKFEQFLNEQVSNGCLTPIQRDMSYKILFELANICKFTVCENPVEEFKEFIKSLPKQVEFDEIATKNRYSAAEEEFLKFSGASEESLEIYKEAKILSEQEKISFKDALLKLYK